MVDGWRVGRRVVAGVMVMAAGFAAVSTVAASHAVSGSTAPLTTAERERLEGEGGATLAVRALTCDGWVRGSAFVVEGWVVTALHVVAGAVTVEIGGTDAAGVPARHFAGLDVAALLPEPATELGFVLADADPAVGAPVVSFGRVDGVVRQREGAVHIYGDGTAYGVDGTVMLIEPGAPPGFSGGPVLDRRGRVVAMTRAVDTTTGLGVAVPVSELDAWLSSPVNEAQYTSCLEQ